MRKLGWAWGLASVRLMLVRHRSVPMGIMAITPTRARLTDTTVRIILQTGFSSAPAPGFTVSMGLGVTATTVAASMIVGTTVVATTVEATTVEDQVAVISMVVMAAVSAAMKRPEISLKVALGLGKGRDRVLTCDLTKEYVAINGGYRS